MKPVAIFGVGPAGLMAAHACALAGRPIALFSKPGPGGKIVKSKLGGAQFLHDPIPGVNEDDADTQIEYMLRGTPEGYRAKLYGDDPKVEFVSMERVSNHVPQQAWNMQKTYDTLWDLLSAESANGVNINAQWVQEAMDKDWFSLIINTIPLNIICRTHADMMPDVPQHRFTSAHVRIMNEPLLEDLPNDVVVYDGTEDASWYRCSKIFGYGSTEFPGMGKLPYTGLVDVRKPVWTNCNCWTGGATGTEILRLGRYGSWTKGVLSHSAFIGAAKAVMH